jgi:uncharacterized peroxidase-related enzyme
MPHVNVPVELPGIVSLFAFRPQTGLPLSQLAETLLRGDSSLTPGERELIAAFVSSCNCTAFCERSHAAAASVHLNDAARVARVCAEGPSAEADPKMRALLAIADAVTKSPQGVTPELVAAARDAGADDIAIHDAVLVAAAFNMYNRYVDGLATIAPPAGPAYDAMGQMLAHEGYMRAVPGAAATV